MSGAPIEPGGSLHQEALADFILVRTDEVDEGERLRPVDPVWAGALGQIMLREKQRTPIEVCRLPGRNRWLLVSGGHRLAGAKFAGIEYLRAEIVTAERKERRLREVSENLWRRDLDPLDRASSLAELVAIRRSSVGLAVAAQRDGNVNARFKKQIGIEADEQLETISSTYGWTEELGRQLGFTGRTIRNDLMLYRGLAASVVDKLRRARHPILANASQLRALAKLEDDEQRRTVDALLSYPALTSVSQARAHLCGTKSVADPETKRFSTVLNTLGRMTAQERLGLFQSSQFHQLMPAQARDLLAVMLRGGDGDADLHAGEDARGLQDGLAGYVSPSGASRDDPNSRDGVRGKPRPSSSPDGLAVDGRSPVSGDHADQLIAAVGFIEAQLGLDADPDWIVGELIRRFHAKALVRDGAHLLRLGGVSSSCTSGSSNLLRAWSSKAWNEIQGPAA